MVPQAEIRLVPPMLFTILLFSSAAMKDLINIISYYAPAGSGNTAIAKTLPHHFSDPSHRRLLATFFFSRIIEGRINPHRFIATIAYHIIHGSHRAIFHNKLQTRTQKLILKPLKRACAPSLKLNEKAAFSSSNRFI
jgi:hypothetical protein